MPAGFDLEDFEHLHINARRMIVINAIQKRTKALEGGISEWWTVVKNGKEGDPISWHERQTLEWKCQYLIFALEEALRNMGSADDWKWKDGCCADAVQAMKRVRIFAATHRDTVMRWHMLFRDNNNLFAHPNPQAAAGKTPEPTFFLEFPEAKLCLIRKADQLLKAHELSVQNLMEYVNDVLIPRLHREHNETLPPDSEISRYCFLRSLHFLRARDEESEDATISFSTVHRWMKALGYRWVKSTKHFYSDRHEDPVTVAYRTSFCGRYMFDYEPRAHRWIQIDRVDADHLRESKSVPEGAGFDYTTTDGMEMTEFHVDDNKQFAILLNQQEKFGGKLSCLFIQVPAAQKRKWKEDGWIKHDYGHDYTTINGLQMTEVHALQFFSKHSQHLKQSMETHNITFSSSVRLPLIMLGQDEVIFKQFIMNLNEWRGRKGEMPTKPKDEGQGLMGSGVNSREFGYGWKLSAAELEVVNAFRRTHRPNYADVDAATKVRGGSRKKDIETDGDSPFSVLFEYGTNGDGYWTYDHMVLQLEDVVDVLDAIYSVPWDGCDSPHNVFVKSATRPKALCRKFEYLFLTDHSCGHDRKRPDGLDVTSLRKGPTAAAKKMRDVQITDGIGIISNKYNHPKKLKVGDVQKLVFGDMDNNGNPETGPFNWTAENRAKFKYDVVDGIKVENLLVSEL